MTPTCSPWRIWPWLSIAGLVLNGCPTCVQPDPGPAGEGGSCDAEIRCKDGLVCQEGTCVSIPGPTGSSSSLGSASSTQSSSGVDGGGTECTNVLQCALNGSVDGRDCVDGQCIFKSCTRDQECGRRSCIEGRCADVSGCTKDEQCTDSVCIDGQCQPGCQDDAECNEGQPVAVFTCDRGHCRQRCVGDQTCLLNGGICEGGVCIPAQCSYDLECTEPGKTRECSIGRCQDYIPCTRDEQCGSPTMFCAPEARCRERPACLRDADCGEEGICFSGRCIPATTCGEGLPECAAGSNCMGGHCVPAAGCRGNSDCPTTKVCRAGQCMDPPQATVARVAISSPVGLCDPGLTSGSACALSARPGETLVLTAVALDGAGRVLAGAAADWTCEPESVAGVSGMGSQALVTLASTGGTAQLTATVQGIASTPLTVTNLGPAPTGVRITVVDGRSGVPVPSATVWVNEATLTTGTDGRAHLAPDQTSAPFTVSVFHQSYDYVTLVELPAEDGGGLDAIIPLEPLSPPLHSAGLRGTVNVDAAPTEGEVSLALAGLSSPSPTSVSFASLLGETFRIDVDLPVLGRQQVPLPGGITLAAQLPVVGPRTFKEGFSVLGTGGRRVAWTFGGHVPLSALQRLVGMVDPVNAIFALVPFMEGLTHGLTTGLVLKEFPYVRDGDTVVDGVEDVDNDGDVDEMVPDYLAFPQTSISVRQEQTLYVGVRFSGFPSGLLGAGQALVVAGSRVPGHGFVPLGLAAIRPSQVEQTFVPVKMAPRYGGLETGDYSLAVYRFGAAGPDAPAEVSLRAASFETLPLQVDLGELMPLASGSSFAVVPVRTLDLLGVQGAHLHRATLEGADGRWRVYLAPGSDRRSVTLPAIPAGLPDRGQRGWVMEGIQVTDALRTTLPTDQVRALVAAQGNLALHRLDQETVGISRAAFIAR